MMQYQVQTVQQQKTVPKSRQHLIKYATVWSHVIINLLL